MNTQSTSGQASTGNATAPTSPVPNAGITPLENEARRTEFIVNRAADVAVQEMESRQMLARGTAPMPPAPSRDPESGEDYFTFGNALGGADGVRLAPSK